MGWGKRGRRLSASWGILLALTAFATTLPLASADDILFENGQRLKNAKIVTQSDGFISIRVNQGVIRYPVSTIRSVNGKPLGEATAARQGKAEQRHELDTFDQQPPIRAIQRCRLRVFLGPVL